jgi:hypothetical protein
VLCFHIALPFYWEVKTYYVYIGVIPSALSKLQSEPDTENSMHYILLGQARSPYRLKKILMLRASAKNNYTSCLSFGPSSALHPPAHISICTDGCALMTNQNPSPYCGIISCRDPIQAGAFIRMVLNGKRPYPDEVLAENFRIKILLEP